MIRCIITLLPSCVSSKIKQWLFVLPKPGQLGSRHHHLLHYHMHNQLKTQIISNQLKLTQTKSSSSLKPLQAHRPAITA
jgi:hypothetical protein